MNLDFITDFQDRLQRIEELLKESRPIEKDTVSQWLTTEEAANALKVSTRTLQSYRDLGQISFSQKGRIIRYLKRHFL